jgi:hypothetical protein
MKKPFRKLSATCAALSALAFSHWGMLRNPAPLVALPNPNLHLSSESQVLTVIKSLWEAVGLNLAIEKTSEIIDGEVII